MMNEITIEMRRETVEDIVKEMRVDAGLSTMGVPQERMSKYAERIEAAAANERACREKVMDAFRSENRRMKAALRIVTDCPTICPQNNGARVPNYSACYDAVCEVQRIIEPTSSPHREAWPKNRNPEVQEATSAANEK